MMSSRSQKMILSRTPKNPLRDAGAATLVVAMRSRFYRESGARDNAHSRPGQCAVSLFCNGFVSRWKTDCNPVPFRYNENEIHFHLEFRTRLNHVAKTD